MFRVWNKSPYGWGTLSQEATDPGDNPEANIAEFVGSAALHNTHRTVFCNDPRSGYQFGYKSNLVSTTKYTVLTFLPKGLFEQFRRVANLYFLLIAILSTTPVSPVAPITNVAPLVIVLAVSLIKEAFEDRKRYISDKVINSSLTEVLRANEWVTTQWANVRVGDVVRVKADHYFPADLLFLASTNNDGVCYIETANLDGETNLKIRKAPEKTWDYITADACSEFRGMIECEQPNNSLYTFTGNLVIGKQTLPISPNQILLRGCSLRNTDWVVGAVVFTGHETKVMMNTMDVPSKRSTLERRLDNVILVLFLILFSLCVIGAIGSAVFLNYNQFYLRLTAPQVEPQFNPGNRLVIGILAMFNLITLYSTIIPISLYVSIEVIKIIQATQFISQDLNMFHRETGTPALARTSNLNEELGQVEYIFTDKTGTLTRNVMEFFKCSVAGVVYGTGTTEVQRAAAMRKGATPQKTFTGRIAGDSTQELEPLKELPEEFLHEKWYNFEDRRLTRGAWRQEKNSQTCLEFFRLLAICHTVLPEGEETPEEIDYLASSPDEAAMVTAAKNFGFFFFRRTPTSVLVRESHVEKLGRVVDVEYEILNILEFNSVRKRQSVVCRHPDGRIVLYSKGADSVMFPRLAYEGNEFVDVTRSHLEQFGEDGLRTLCFAYRQLDPAFYATWNDKFTAAKSALKEREKRLDEVAEMIERELVLLGATAIEDKLQDGVPLCIETLKKAGIKIWVLTGDKMETAINIAYACSLLTNQMKQFIITSETEAIRTVEELGNDEETARVIRESVFKQLRESIRQAVVLDREGFQCALVIDGRCLMYALDPLMRGTLLQLGVICSAVVCCRVSPLQKAQVTHLMKEGAGKITLSIGDGANDVSMIQAAHVGVGISGHEGMQAVMAADFAIAQFRFLTDLLLVHGRWSYIRLSKVVAYFFYKNLAFTLTTFWFNCFAGFSGQRLYDDWFQAFYNVVFTALPVVVVGLFDKDVDAKWSKSYPQLYRAGIRNIFFSWNVLGVWLGFAVAQSLLVFFFSVAGAWGAVPTEGKTLGLWEIGTISYACVIIAVNLRLLLMVDYYNVWHFVSISFSILVWFVSVLVYDAIVPKSKDTSWDSQSNQYWVIYVLLKMPSFYLMLILIPTVALLPDFLYISAQRWLYPHDFQIVQEEVKEHQGDVYDMDRTLEMESMAETPPKPDRDELRRQAMASLPSLASKKHTGFAFDTPGFESFFAQQEGIAAPPRAWDVARRASVARKRPERVSELPELSKFPERMPTTSGEFSGSEIVEDASYAGPSKVIHSLPSQAMAEFAASAKHPSADSLI